MRRLEDAVIVPSVGGWADIRGHRALRLGALGRGSLEGVDRHSVTGLIAPFSPCIICLSDFPQNVY